MGSLMLSLSLTLGLLISTANAEMNVTNTLTEGHARSLMQMVSHMPWTEEGVQQPTGKLIFQPSDLYSFI